MKRAVALLLLLAAAPALAQDTPPAPISNEQACMTWLSLASRFATDEGQRTVFDQEYLRLNRQVSARTDEVGNASMTQVNPGTDVYNRWVMDYDLAEDAVKDKLLAELTAHAADCETVVPSAANASSTTP